MDGVAAAAATADVEAGATAEATSAVRVTRAASGITVVTDPVPGARSIALGAWVGVGSRDEPAERAGTCHFLEHLLFKGTEERSALDLAREVERAGGELDAWTSLEHTVVHGRFPGRHVRLAAEILGEVLSAPALRPADVELERGVIVEELASALDVPEDEAWVALHEAQYPGHPMGRETLGTEASLRAISSADVVTFFDRNFSAERMVVSAAGVVDHDELVALVDERFPTRQAAGELGRLRPIHARSTRVELRRHCEQGQLLMSWEHLCASDPGRHAAAVLTQILGGGSASRLFQSVREQRGLAYSVYATSHAHSDTGSLVVGAATAPGRLDEVEQLVRDEIVQLRRGIDADDLTTAIGALCGSLELAAEDPGARMAGAALGISERGDPGDLDDELAAIAAVSAGDVAAAAQRWLHDEPVVVAVRPV